jgi:hypothetical protein
MIVHNAPSWGIDPARQAFTSRESGGGFMVEVSPARLRATELTTILNRCATADNPFRELFFGFRYYSTGC